MILLIINCANVQFCRSPKTNLVVLTGRLRGEGKEEKKKKKKKKKYKKKVTGKISKKKKEKTAKMRVLMPLRFFSF